MADVKVGQVRRRLPSVETAGAAVYRAAPFAVVALDKLEVRVRINGVEHWMFRADVARCPLWPAEHEQWKAARGYEVKTRGGPATRMFEAFEFIAEHSQAPTAIRSAAERVLEDITPATLEAMDAAAEVMADADLDPEGRDLCNLPPSPAAERAVLRVLLEREVKRRKELGHA